MRLLFFPQFYFFGSVLLHGLVFSLLALNILEFTTKPEPFQASVLFEPVPEVQKEPEPVIKQQPKPEEIETAPKTEEKIINSSTEEVPPIEPLDEIKKPVLPPPVAKPTLKPDSLLPSNIKTNIETPEHINKSNIDEILKQKLDQPIVPNTKIEKIDVKKTNLLGYLRANKKTKEAAKPLPPVASKPVVKKPEKIEVKQNPLLNKTEKQTTQQEKTTNDPITSNTSEKTKPKISTSERLQSQINSSKGSSPTEKTGKNTKDTSADQKAARLQIWQKKKETQTYKTILGKLVSANWNLPITGKQFTIIVEATIDKNGNLINSSIVESSGLSVLDASAKRAILVSTPFPKLPESLTKDSTYTAVFRFTPEGVGF